MASEDFLDLSKQSPSWSNPRRVVPTISIILYFNSVFWMGNLERSKTFRGRRSARNS